MDVPEVAVANAAAACSRAVHRLRDAGVAPEALAHLEPAGRRLLVFPRAPRMRRVGEVWRLGVLLLDTDARLYVAGRLTRAAERGRLGYQSLSLEERRDVAAAALRGGFPAGAAVNFDARMLSLDAPDSVSGSPLGYDQGAIRVRWHPSAPLQGAPTLEQYLAERVDLLIDPPLRST